MLLLAYVGDVDYEQVMDGDDGNDGDGGDDGDDGNGLVKRDWQTFS